MYSNALFTTDHETKSSPRHRGAFKTLVLRKSPYGVDLIVKSSASALFLNKKKSQRSKQAETRGSSVAGVGRHVLRYTTRHKITLIAVYIYFTRWGKR